MKYRKKPVIIDAIQWNGDNAIEIMDFVGQELQVTKPTSSHEKELDNIPDSTYSITIPTLEGDMKASRGDYIIKGIKGEFYPCKPDIFIKTYEIVELPSSGQL